MIKIIPNILTENERDFEIQIEHLSIFPLVDIDIAVSPFTEKSSVALEKTINLIKKFSRINYTFHLMEENPEKSIQQILECNLNIDQVYIHQESNISIFKTLQSKVKKKIGITIRRESRLRAIDFYNQFGAIQLMTGVFGGQGNEFDEESLAKSLQLRDMGYEGEIGIDGGVNLQSAIIIKDYPVDRVSVGSFIRKSQNPMLDKMKLDLALNMRTVE